MCSTLIKFPLCDGGDWFLFVLICLTLLVSGIALFVTLLDFYNDYIKPLVVKIYNRIFYKKAIIVPIPEAVETTHFNSVNYVARDVTVVEVIVV